VGQRYFLNDQANDYSRLNGYMTADTRLSWSRKDLTATFGINNLFNKRYSEYAGVNVDDGVKFYYPSPERNFTLKLDYKF
jgi:outer membrane receptor protein involved in Fe transport